MVEGKSKCKAALDAGYSRNSHTSDLDKRPAAGVAIRQVQAEREALMQKEGFTIKDLAERVKKRATDPKVPAATQTDNDKVLIGILGYNAPAKIDIKTTSLIADLGVLSGEDLEELRNSLAGEGVEDAEFEEVVEDDWLGEL